MQKQKIISLCGMVLLLLLGMVANGQPTPITINGPTQVCQGTKHLYDYAPTPDLFYQWGINPNGYISGVTGNQALVYWGASGLGVLTVYGIDTLGDTVELGIANVSILPKPQPLITSNSIVACQPLGPPVEPDTIPVFNDTGCMKVCENSTVTYTAHGATTSTYTWTVIGGAAAPAGNTCNVTWGPSGPGSISVTETTIDGCEGTKTICIDIIEAPIADFFAFPDSTTTSINICDSTEVIFIDRSTASPGSPIVAWHWDFGDGTYSNAQGGRNMPITHLYQGPGHYIAILTVTNACGCQSSFQIDIHVDPQKALPIECPRVMCEGDTGHYSINTTCMGTNWSAMGGTVINQTGNTASIVWDNVDANGFGYVFYDARNCHGVCPAIFVAKVPVVLQSGTIQGPDTICPGTQYMYRLPQWPSTYFSWNETTGFGTLLPSDQPNEIIVTVDASNAGNTITIENNYRNSLFNCTGFATKDVYVQELPVMDGPDIVCLNSNATYTLSGAGGVSTASWTLTYPDLSTATGSGASFVGLFDQVGPYLLSVQGDFCSPPVKEIVVKDMPPMPDDILGPDTICKGAPTKYEAINELQGYVFNWMVDNGIANAASGNTSYVTLNMGSTGPFVIKVWRESKDAPYCPSDTFTKTIDTPVVIFDIDGADTVCPSSYENYSVNYEKGETYEWRIDDQLMGSVMQGQGTKDVQVLWNNAPGTALLICKIRKCYGNFYEDTLEVYIRPQTTVSITGPGGVCSGVGFQLSVSGDGTSVDWTMGDGIESKGQPSTIWHTYNIGNSAPKTMHVIAVVNNPNGCEGTAMATKNITVDPGPVSRIASTGPSIYYCDSNVNQTLSVMLYNGFPSITSYQWFRNGVSVGSGSTYNATQFGFYTVKVTGSNGCVYTTGIYSISYECQDTCELEFEPTLSIDSVSIDSCGYVYAKASYSATGFISSGWGSNGGIVTWSEDNEAYIKYDSAKVYTIEFGAFYTDGTDTCWFSTKRSVAIPYMAKLGIEYLCTSSGGPGTRDIVINFTGTQTGPITSFTFKVDGSTVYSGANNSTTTNVTTGVNHIFELIIGDGTNPTCWAMLDQYIDSLPFANFDWDTTCAVQAPVVFGNTSIATAGYLSFWEFGDGAENIQNSPERVYKDPSPPTKDVKLTITDAFGCTDDTTQDVFVMPMRLIGDINTTPSSPCQGQPVTLNYIPDPLTFYPDWYEWMDDEVNFASGTFNPMTVFESGYYWVRGTDNYGCYVETIADSVHIVEVPPAFVSGDTAQCVDVPFILSGYAGSDPNIQYSWLLSGSIISGETSPILKQTQSGSGIYDYQVIITVPNPGGGFCSDTSLPFLVYVRSLPTPPSIVYNIINCNDYTVQLHASPALPWGTYNWSTGTSGSSTFVKTGGNFQLRYTDTFGCVSRSTEDVPKDPRVYLWIFPTGCYTICPPEVLTVTGPIIKFAEWRYLRNGGIDFSGTNSIPLDYTIWREGVYNLYLDNGWCNVTSGNMVVDTNCSGPGGGGEGKPGRSSVLSLNSGDVSMSLAPNPARDEVTIQYLFNSGSRDRRIEVYDLTGRLVAAHQAPAEEGNWTLKLDLLSSGIYNAVLREDGNVLLYGKLSVVK